MPTYVYEQHDHSDEPVLKEFDEKYPDSIRFDTFELNVPIEQRDQVLCGVCRQPHKRKVVFTGLTWAPTAGGMR